MSSGASTPGSAPKSMSSRLLTMKFMQRAAASPPTTTSPSTLEEPSSKRRKKDSDSPSKLSFDVNALADQRAIQAAVAEEAAKRQAALERAEAEAGDTRWVLSFEDQKASSASPTLTLRVVQTGYANLDTPSSFGPTDEDMEEDKPVMVGRRSFGKFNKVLEVRCIAAVTVQFDEYDVILETNQFCRRNRMGMRSLIQIQMATRTRTRMKNLKRAHQMTTTQRAN